MRLDQDDMGAGNPGSSEPPADDVATLYSWANLHGAKYKDFSASRQQVRAQMRQRVLTDQAKIAREEAQKAPPPELPRWEDLLPGGGRPAGGLGPVRHEIPAETRFESPAHMDRHPGALPLARETANGPQETGNNSPRETGNVLRETGNAPRYGLTGAPHFGDPMADSREKLPPEPRYPAERSAAPESAPERPAWLMETHPTVVAQVPTPPSAGSGVPGGGVTGSGTPHPSPGRGGSRWYALRGIFGREPEEVQTERVEGMVPVLAVFSLAGGVGKTSLVAGVGRGLAARGERVLLTDTCAYGVLPFYFGANEVRPGVLRTFSGWTNDPPIRVLTLETGRYEADPDLLRREMTRGARDVSRVLIDIGNASTVMLRQAMRLSPTVLVPLVPDMASVVTLQALEPHLRNQEALNGNPIQTWYLLNQFDPSSELQQDVRELLREQLGERLLPVEVRRSAAMSEALAEGMTVIDYAPNSPAAEDIMNLVTWIRNTSVAAGGGHRVMRWSER